MCILQQGLIPSVLFSREMLLNGTNLYRYFIFIIEHLAVPIKQNSCVETLLAMSQFIFEEGWEMKLWRGLGTKHCEQMTVSDHSSLDLPLKISFPSTKNAHTAALNINEDLNNVYFNSNIKPDTIVKSITSSTRSFEPLIVNTVDGFCTAI